jgi:hypothetical protein
MTSSIRFTAVLAVIAAIPMCLSAQAPGGRVMTPPAPAAVAPAGPGPRIQFNTEDCDFGKVLKGDPVKFIFVATNTGDETLEIKDAKGTCSCTVVGDDLSKSTWTPQKVAPGQTCRIPVEIATGNFVSQPISKLVTVTSNDKTRPVVNLQLHGVIWQPIEVAPSMLSFTLSPGVTNLSQKVRISNRMETPLELSDPRSNTNVFTPTLKTITPGQEFELAVAAVCPANMRPGLGSTTIIGEISLTTSATNKNPLTITVYGTVMPEITVFPPGIQLPVSPLVQPIISRVTIRDYNTNLMVSNPAASVSGVDVSLLMLQTNRTYVLSVVFPRDFQAKPGQNVTVNTDNPRFPVITIPITPVPGMAQPVRPAVRANLGSATNAARAGLPVPAVATNAAASPPKPVQP